MIIQRFCSAMTVSKPQESLQLIQLSQKQKVILIVTLIVTATLTTLGIILSATKKSYAHKLPVNFNSNPNPNNINPFNLNFDNTYNNNLLKFDNEKYNQGLSELEDCEEQIDLIQENLQLEQQTLECMGDFDPKSFENLENKQSIQKKQIQLKIKDLQKDLDNILKKYPAKWNAYLKEAVKGQFNHFHQEIYQHISKLSGYMDKNVDDEDFIYDCLKQIYSFLTNSLFSSNKNEMSLQEEKKNDLMGFNGLFAIVNNHYQFLENKHPELAMELKLKLANLPLRDQISALYDAAGKVIQSCVPADRQKLFPNIYFSEKNQLDTLIKHFKNQEDACVAQLILGLGVENINFNDLHKLVKMFSPSRSHLAHDNMLKLQNALITKLEGGVVNDWNDLKEVQKKLETACKGLLSSYDSKINLFGQNPVTSILKLHRVSKARQYFDAQSGWKEDEIQIPRWYHTTKMLNIAPIIKAGQINVEHKQVFKGAWISTDVEWDFGQDAFVFNHHIVKLDPNVFIGYEKGAQKRRWRGMQAPIPLVDSATKISNVCLVGLNKFAIKDNKAQTLANLANIGVSNPKVFTIDQVKFMKDEIVKAIGSPNLSDRWWGKADANKLETI